MEIQEIVKICPKCGAKRTIRTNYRSLEKETGNPCSSCYDWADQMHEPKESEEIEKTI